MIRLLLCMMLVFAACYDDYDIDPGWECFSDMEKCINTIRYNCINHQWQITEDCNQTKYVYKTCWEYDAMHCFQNGIFLDTCCN